MTRSIATSVLLSWYFNLLSKVKMILRRVRFEDLNKLNVVLWTEPYRSTLDCLATGITDLRMRSNTVNQLMSQYFDGLYILCVPIYSRLFVTKSLSLLIDVNVAKTFSNSWTDKNKNKKYICNWNAIVQSMYK